MRIKAPPLWRPPKLHRVGKNFAIVHAIVPRFSTEQLPRRPFHKYLYPPLLSLRALSDTGQEQIQNFGKAVPGTC